MLFGEYLVKTGVITEDQLIECLVEQARSQPSMLEVVHRSNLLSGVDIMRVCTVQAKSGFGFIEACKSTGLWSQDLAQKIEAELAGARKPIGEVIVEKKYAEVQSIVNALDEFFDQEAVDPESAAAVNEPAVKTDMEPTADAESTADQELTVDADSASQEATDEAVSAAEVVADSAVTDAAQKTGSTGAAAEEDDDLRALAEAMQQSADEVPAAASGSIFADEVSVTPITAHFETEGGLDNKQYWEEGFNLLHFLKGVFHFHGLEQVSGLMNEAEEVIRDLIANFDSITPEQALATQKFCVVMLKRIEACADKLQSSDDKASIESVDQMAIWGELGAQGKTIAGHIRR